MTDIAKKASSALEEREPVWQYADAPESTEIVKLQERYGLFIGGEFVEPKSGKWFATINPATEEKLAEVADAGPEDVDLAVTDRAQGLQGAVAQASRGASAPSTSTGSRASSRSAPASSRCSRR